MVINLQEITNFYHYLVRQVVVVRFVHATNTKIDSLLSKKIGKVAVLNYCVRHVPVSAPLQCTIRVFQPPLPAPLSAIFIDSFPEGTILAYRDPHVAQYQDRYLLYARSLIDHERVLPNLFPAPVWH
jgi:hypothetical protein